MADKKKKSHTRNLLLGDPHTRRRVELLYSRYARGDQTLEDWRAHPIFDHLVYHAAARQQHRASEVAQLIGVNLELIMEEL